MAAGLVSKTAPGPGAPYMYHIPANSLQVPKVTPPWVNSPPERLPASLPAQDQGDTESIHTHHM